MLSLGSTKVNLHCRLCSSMVCAQINKLGYQYSPSVISITRMIATPCAPKTRGTHLTESSLDTIPHPRQSLFTTFATKNTTNQTAIVLIPIVFHLQSTQTSNMTAAYLFLFIETVLLLSTNPFPRAQGWLKSTPQPAAPNRAPLWIYLLILTRPCTTWCNLMMVFLPQFQPQKCLTLSPNHQSTCPTISTSFRHSLKLVLLKKDGQYHKGYLTQIPDGSYWFSCKSHINKKQED
jgi:hypothetical protein